MKKTTLLPQYSPALAADLSGLAKSLGIPKKFINLWRQEWLSYPVTPDQFQALIIIATHVWGVDTCIKAQLARKSVGDRAPH
jgi:hypothetical protein